MTKRRATRCTARANATGVQCNRQALIGGTVCYVHGGAAKQVRAAAQRRTVETQTQAIAAKYAQPRDDITPSQALVEELRRAGGLVDWLERRLREGDDKPLTSIEWQMLGAERDRLSRLATDLSRLGIEQTMLESELERARNEMAEHSSQTIAVLLEIALAELGVTWSDRELRLRLDHDLRYWAAKHLTVLLHDRRTAKGLNTFGAQRPDDGQPEELVEALRTWRAVAEKPLRDRIAQLEADNERLRGRVQSDGMTTRLALPAAPDPDDVDDPVDVAEEVAAAALAEQEPDVLEDGEVILPEQPPARPRGGQSLREHFLEARRSAGFRP